MDPSLELDDTADFAAGPCSKAAGGLALEPSVELEEVDDELPDELAGAAAGAGSFLLEAALLPAAFAFFFGLYAYMGLGQKVK